MSTPRRGSHMTISCLNAAKVMREARSRPLKKLDPKNLGLPVSTHIQRGLIDLPLGEFKVSDEARRQHCSSQKLQLSK